jgi:hypothetical protein
MSNKSNNSKVWVLLCLLVFAGCIILPCAANAQGIQATEITDCVNSDVSGLTCEKKMVVTFPVSYGLSQSLVVEPNSGDPNLELTITKTAPVLNYPLTYFHTVAYYPYEQVLKEPNTTGPCFVCMDSPDSNCPTCGWTYIDGEKVEHSQGFCVHDIIDSPCSWWRGKELYGEHPNEAPFSTAHCLKMGEVYFDGYEIGEYKKHYEVKVETNRGEDMYTFVVTPADTVHVPDPEETNIKVKAALLGDLDEYSGAVELDNYILYIPSKPVDHPMVQQYQNNMLLVPREEVSKDGGELDKVGVSFYKFRTQAGNWTISQAGDGLHNQLYQKHNSDLEKLTVDPNFDATYLVHQKKPFEKSMNFISVMAKILQHRIWEINHSLVSLTLERGSIKSTENESDGIIDYAYVEDFNEMSREGTLHVMIRNMGATPGNTDYIVTCTDFNLNILNAVGAQARTLARTDSAELSFDIYTKYNMDTSNEGLVTLKSPTGKVYDKVVAKFDTKKHRSDYSWELQQKNEASVASEGVSVLGDSTCDKVVDFRDFADLARCWLAGAEPE